MRKIDWLRTLRNFVLLVILGYTIASVYLITTNRKAFNEYKEYNTTRALLTNTDIVDLVLIAADVNTNDVRRRKRNAKIMAVTSYATFAIDYIIGE